MKTHKINGREWDANKMKDINIQTDWVGVRNEKEFNLSDKKMLLLLHKPFTKTELKTYMYYEKDVKETFKKLKDFCDIHKGTLVCADTFLEVMIEGLGKELCEEVARDK